MKKLLLLLTILCASIAGYSQMNTFGGIGLRVNDTTTYQTNAAAYHTAGYRDIYFNNQATTKHFDVWNGSSYEHVFSFGGGSGSGVTTMAAIGSSPNANGATISGSTLNLQPADTTYGGVITTGTQLMKGQKSFYTATDEFFKIINHTNTTSNGVGLEIQQSGADNNGAIIDLYNSYPSLGDGERIYENHAYARNSSNVKTQYQAYYVETDKITAGSEYGRSLQNIKSNGTSRVAFDIGPVKYGSTYYPGGFWFNWCSTCSANMNITSSINNINTGSDAYAEIRIGNESNDIQTNSLSSLNLMTFSTGYGTVGMYKQDGVGIQAGANLSGGMSITSAHTSGDIRFYTGGSADANRRVEIDETGYVYMLTGAGIGGNATAAGYLRISEDTDDGSNFSQFQVAAQSANITYTLPTAAPTASGYVLSSTTGGTMSWVAKTGTLNTETTTVGNITTGEDQLFSYTVPAATLATNGNSIKGRMSGFIANNANSKTFKLKFGGTTFMTRATALPTIGTAWTIDYEIIRTGATTQKCNATFSGSDGTASAFYATAGETLSGTVAIVLTGEATSTDDIVKETSKVKFED